MMIRVYGTVVSRVSGNLWFRFGSGVRGDLMYHEAPSCPIERLIQGMCLQKIGDFIIIMDTQTPVIVTFFSSQSCSSSGTVVTF